MKRLPIPGLQKPLPALGAVTLALTACVATLTPTWRTAITSAPAELLNLHSLVAAKQQSSTYFYTATDGQPIEVSDPALSTVALRYRTVGETGKIYSLYWDYTSNQLYVTRHDQPDTLTWTSPVIQEEPASPDSPVQNAIFENGNSEIWVVSWSNPSFGNQNGYLRAVRLSALNGSILSTHIIRNLGDAYEPVGLLHDRLIVQHYLTPVESNDSVEVDALDASLNQVWRFNPSELAAYQNTEPDYSGRLLQVKGDSLYWVYSFRNHAANPVLFTLNGAGALKWQTDLGNPMPNINARDYPLEVEMEESGGVTYIAKGGYNQSHLPEVTLEARNSQSGGVLWSKPVSLPAVQYPVVIKPPIFKTVKENTETVHVDLTQNASGVFVMVSDKKYTGWYASLIDSIATIVSAWTALGKVEQYSPQGSLLNSYTISGFSTQFTNGDGKSFFTLTQPSGDKSGSLYINRFDPK